MVGMVLDMVVVDIMNTHLKSSLKVVIFSRILTKKYAPLNIEVVGGYRNKLDQKEYDQARTQMFVEVGIKKNPFRQ